MSTTTIAGWVAAWGDDAPRAQLPVRCLEDELLPPVSPTAPRFLEDAAREKKRAANQLDYRRKQALARSEARAYAKAGGRHE